MWIAARAAMRMGESVVHDEDEISSSIHRKTILWDTRCGRQEERPHEANRSVDNLGQTLGA